MRYEMKPTLEAQIITLRRQLHQIPELGFEEHKTAQRVTQALDALGISHLKGQAGTGIVASLGPATGPVVMLRADLDGLPIHERTDLPFTSTHPGKMHACGHDGHAAMLIGAATLLRDGPPLSGPIRLVWQPAEETALGASALIEAGVLEGVEMAFGAHLDMNAPAGHLLITPGVVNAYTDSFEIHIEGKGGHGARPHRCVDPIVAASQLVLSLQTIVSRELGPGEAGVITVGTLKGGVAPNVIAQEVRLSGTLRTLDGHARRTCIDAIKRHCEGIALQSRTRISPKLTRGSPSVVNAPTPTAIAREAAALHCRPDQIGQLAEVNMGGEDFAFFSQRVPSCYIRIGAAPVKRPVAPAHSPLFDFNEAALRVGAEWFAQTAWLATEHLRRTR